MRTLTFPLLLIAGLGIAAPAAAQTDFGDILSGVAKSLVNQELDKNAYAQAQSANTVAAYRGYLSQYPSGAYRANAERALQRLGASVSPVTPTRPGTNQPTSPVASAAATEAAIGLTRVRRMELQTQLSTLGYPTGVADGLWGANTRAAIGRWQVANSLARTGYLTERQVALIDRQAGPTAAPVPVASGSADDRTEEILLSLTASERRDIQRRLTSLGYSTGGADGVFGANTRRAISAWQRDEALRVTGYITADQLRELRRQTG